VSVSSLSRYRRALGNFVMSLPERLGDAPSPALRAIEGDAA
jgi:hypothetical protein